MTSDCPECGEWRDAPFADCANCGYFPRACGDPLGACLYRGPHDGPHKVAPDHPVLSARLARGRVVAANPEPSPLHREAGRGVGRDGDTEVETIRWDDGSYTVADVRRADP